MNLNKDEIFAWFKGPVMLNTVSEIKFVCRCVEKFYELKRAIARRTVFSGKDKDRDKAYTLNDLKDGNEVADTAKPLVIVSTWNS
jgi:hypothetical protein